MHNKGNSEEERKNMQKKLLGRKKNQNMIKNECRSQTVHLF